MCRAHACASTTAVLLAATGLLTFDCRATLRCFRTRRDPGSATRLAGVCHDTTRNTLFEDLRGGELICSCEAGERGDGAKALTDHSSQAKEPNVALREAGESIRWCQARYRRPTCNLIPSKAQEPPRSINGASTVPVLLAILRRGRLATMAGLSATPVWLLCTVRSQTSHARRVGMRERRVHLIEESEPLRF